jgi:hypothetical protein
MSWLSESSITDRTYAISFTAVLGLSLLALGVTRYISQDPIFTRNAVFKRAPYAHEGLEPLLANGHSENGSIADRKTPHPEPLKGWRLRMGIFQGCFLLALVVAHSAILGLNGTSVLQLVFITYWVFIYSI